VKRFIFIICLILIIYESSLTVPTLKAQPYPNRPIQLIVPIEAGTPADINGRLLAEELKKILKVQIVVINKPGASMVLGTDFVVKSKKDGYTILYAPATGITYVRAIQPETVPYDPMKDLEPLGLHMFFAVGIAVLESAPWKTFAEFVDYAKENPGKIRISTPGIQTTSSFNIVII